MIKKPLAGSSSEFYILCNWLCGKNVKLPRKTYGARGEQFYSCVFVSLAEYFIVRKDDWADDIDQYNRRTLLQWWRSWRKINRGLSWKDLKTIVCSHKITCHFQCQDKSTAIISLIVLSLPSPGFNIRILYTWDKHRNLHIQVLCPFWRTDELFCMREWHVALVTVLVLL